MCAAPGGKTCHIACTMAGKGLLVAVDRSKKKVQLSCYCFSCCCSSCFSSCFSSLQLPKLVDCLGCLELLDVTTAAAVLFLFCCVCACVSKSFSLAKL